MNQNLILAGVVTKESVKNYKNTVDPPINTSKLKKFVLPTAVINQKSISVWALNETKENKRIWDLVKKSDLIIFFKNNKYFLKGTVMHKVRHEEMYSRILGVKQTRKLLLFISETEFIDIDFKTCIPIFTNESIIINSHEFPINMVSKNNLKLLEDTFVNLENCFSHIKSIQNRKLSVLDIINKINLKEETKFDTEYVVTKKRKGQKAFSDNVLKNFKNKCAVCRISQKNLLQGAHIVQINDKKKAGLTKNGICLCVTCHKLFDDGYFSFNDEYRNIISKNKKMDPMLKKIIWENKKIGDCLIKPSLEFLLYHRIKFKILQQ